MTNDISNSRAKALLKNVEVFGIPNVYVVSEDPKIYSLGLMIFDKILIDATHVPVRECSEKTISL